MSLKILHISISLSSGGAEKLLVEALPKYAAAGIIADLLLLDGTDTPFFKELRKSFTGKVFISKWRSVYSPLHILEIRKHIKHYDVVHVHLFPPMYLVALTKLLFRVQTPLVFTEHSTFNRRIKNVVFRRIDLWIYSIYTKITAITPQVKEQLVNKVGIKEKDCEVILNGIDLNKFGQAKPYDSSDFFADPKTKIILQVSSFQESKDQKTVIHALLLLSKKIKLILVGEGKLQGQYMAMVEALKLTDRVLFLGLRMDIPELLKTATIVVQSSNWEGFGLAAVEGMAAGKPVIASNVSGLKEIVEHAGLIFEKGNPKDLADQINRLLADETLYNLVSERCKIKAKDYSIMTMVNRFIDLYKNV